MRTAVLALAMGLGVVMAAGQSIQTLKLDAVQPLYLVSADLNRDGFPDLAVACHSSNSVVIFENTRLPCTSFKEKVQWVLEDSPVALAVGYFMDSRLFTYGAHLFSVHLGLPQPCSCHPVPTGRGALHPR